MNNFTTRIFISLTFLCLLCGINITEAAAAPSIGIAARYRNRVLVLRVSTNTEGLGCRFDVYATDSLVQSLSRPERGTKIFTNTATQSSFRLQTDPLSLIKRSSSNRSSKTIYLRSRITCGQIVRTSPIVRFTQTLPPTGGIILSRWYEQTRNELRESFNELYQNTPTPTPTIPVPNVTVTRTFSNLSFSSPVEFVAAKDGSNRNFVVQQAGKIFSFLNDPNTSSTTEVIDVSTKISTGGERGLLGLALHPSFPTTPYIYLFYTRVSDGALTISRFTFNNAATTADINSELVLLTIAHAANSNHNGGKLAFGPDGFLYIATGDGGGSGDPQGNGQNVATLLGKILRIDVNSTEGSNNYAIPSTNFFKGNSIGAREEIFAFGFRNPWKMSFDTSTGILFAADVGQGAREEVDLVESGKNYGWNTMEGKICYPSGNTSCDMSGLTLPLHDYDRTVGESITGGYVYRGNELPGLRGLYIYGDFITGRIFGFKYQNGVVTNYPLFDSDLQISTFGQDQNGEVLILNYSNGQIYKFAAS